ncbi:MAG: ABC transporter ATP-binding protein [Pseudomonadota bacterium]
MNAIECERVCKRYPHFALNNVDLTLPTGTVLGFVGPNGAGKSTTIRIIMGLVHQDAGQVRVLGQEMPAQQVKAKWDVGFVSEDMRLYSHRTLGFHLKFLRSIYPAWDDAYTRDLLDRFELNPEQKVKGLSHGQRVKAALLTVFVRRPKLLVFDEPTTGLDPVARKVILEEMMRVLEDDQRSILFSSHNTLEVEQISDHIAFINRGSIVASQEKEAFMDSWRRLRLVVNGDFKMPSLKQLVESQQSGRQLTLTVSDFSEALEQQVRETGAEIRQVERLTLEEIFIASVEAHQRAARADAKQADENQEIAA